MVAVTVALSLNNVFSKKNMALNFDDISLLTCGLCNILARLAEADCNQQKHMETDFKTMT